MHDEVQHQLLLVRRHLELLNKHVDELQVAVAEERAKRECEPDYGSVADKRDQG